MDQQTLLGVLTAFTLAQRQILLTLELLMNDNRRITYTPSDTRHRIRQLAYFRMIHELDLVCVAKARKWTGEHSQFYVIYFGLYLVFRPPRLSTLKKW
uniref:Retrotransposon protein n=1 Tax=Cucumis melo TaxID=3656 RepID=A0A9I9E5L7_CUCME